MADVIGLPRGTKKPTAFTWLHDCQVDERGHVLANLASTMIALRQDPDVSEVVAYDDLISLGGMNEAKSKGKLRLEGKEYLVKDGDIVHIRSSL